MTHANSSANLPADAWLVVWTESRAEKQVAARIAAQGIEPWLPTVTERKRWSDRWKEVVLPLFPGYLFARATAGQLSSVLRTPGVMTVVKARGRPAMVSDEFIETLRAAVERSGLQGAPVSEDMSFHLNDEVVVSEGPLAGVRGFVREIRSHRWLVIWVREIGRGVAFTIGSASVRPVSV